MTRPDFIVIGAGSAGCVVARVLAERKFSVLLLEAGQNTPVGRAPALYPQSFGSSEDWSYESLPQSHLANRRISWPRGRGPGGSTRINAMIWYPPPMHDLQALARAGGRDWSVDQLTDSLQAMEQWVRPEPPRWLSEATQRFLRTEANGPFRGHPFLRMTRQGQRFTAADLLAESHAAGRVQTVTAAASRIQFDGERACGVEWMPMNRSQPEMIEANLGIILSGGAIGSPTLLIRSGIGPAEFIADNRATAAPRLAHEEVGSNLSDHLIMPVVYAVPPHHRFPSAADCRSLARFRIAATGPLASNLAEAGGIFSRPSLPDQQTDASAPGPGGVAPWAQIHFTPTHYLLHPSHAAPAALTIGVNLCHPRSRGRLRMRPAESPGSGCEFDIDPGYLSDPQDRIDLLHAIRFARELAQQEPLASFHQEELIPGARRDGDDALIRSLARYAQTLYHPAGTCRMGQDPQSVVDERLAVRGIRGLHIVDASVLPTTPSVNPNALVMMLALHAAARIAESAL